MYTSRYKGYKQLTKQMRIQIQVTQKIIKTYNKNTQNRTCCNIFLFVYTLESSGS